jgi:beta-lactamase class A
MKALTRRAALVGTGAVLAACASQSPVPETAATQSPAPYAPLAELEARSGCKLGAFILDTANGNSVGHRADELFGMCSTFKMSLAGITLMAADAGRLSLDQQVPFSPADMMSNAPIAEANLAAGFMTVGQMAEGTQKTSDNVCANLLLRLHGGPEGYTVKIRSLGDTVTRVDRFEPTMNVVVPGDPRDSTSPRAHAGLMKALLLGDALAPQSRAMLRQWMIDTTTGLRRIRAGFSADWTVGDKTGTGLHESMPNRTNDLAIALREGRAPLIITAYVESPYFDGIKDEDQAVLAEVGRIAAAWASA